jgi:pimeloyl-ACP methyl ester carboxylesterase
MLFVHPVCSVEVWNCCLPVRRFGFTISLMTTSHPYVPSRLPEPPKKSRLRRIGRFFGFLFLFILLLLLIGPFLIPIPPLTDTIPVRQLAEPDSRFATLNGLDLHYKSVGNGEPALILLHGFAASVFSWREVMEPLSQYGRVVAFDRPAFGFTERPLTWSGQNPYSPEGQISLTIALMDHLGIQQAVLVGNSAGGAVAVNTALAHPDRVAGLILISPAISVGGGTPGWIRPILRTPQMNRLGPLFVRSFSQSGIEFGRSAWHNPDLLTDEMWAGYTKPLQAENWDRGLWLMTTASRAPAVTDRLAEIGVPVLIVTGDDDRIVATSRTVALAEQWPAATLHVFPACGHVAHEECPQPFLEAVAQFWPRISGGR